MNKPEAASKKRICENCVGESFLKELINTKGTDAICSYCEEKSKTITIDELANLIEEAFENHFKRTPTEPDDFEAAMNNDRESSYRWRRKGSEVVWAIANAADIKEEAAKDVLLVLEDRHSDFEKAKMGEEAEFDRDSHYEEINPGCEEFSQKWNEFENGLKTEARFFSLSAKVTLDEIFAGLLNLWTTEGRYVVANAGPKAGIKFLYRARVFAGDDEGLQEALKYPWKHLGPPPMRSANAGRMNARGISVFYGAMDAATALAEVRPPVGSQVVIAKFILERPLKLLDVEALKSVATAGSIFDPNYLARIQRANFLRILSNRISRPVMPNEEAFEYLATQAVADYLATEANLDGIIFPSVQVGHTASNVVLFHRSSRVEGIELQKGTEISIDLEQHDDDDDAPDYHVWEVVFPPPATAQKEPSPLDFDILTPFHEPLDSRPPSLKIDLDSVTVHDIKAVKFSAKEYPVDRLHAVMPESEPPQAQKDLIPPPQTDIFE